MSVYEIPADKYHTDDIGAEQPALSSTIANVLLNQSPLHAHHAHPKLNPLYERVEDSKFDKGTVIHRLLLDGNADRVKVLEFKDWKTNAAQDARDEARAAGMIPLLTKDWDGCQEIADAVVARLREMNVTPPPLRDGKPEQTVVWEEDGLTMKARLDWLHDDLTAIDDLKTTSRSANPFTWERTIFNMGYDVQAAFYCRGLHVATGAVPEWRWVVVEVAPPHAVSVMSLAPDAMALADAKVDRAILKWRNAMDSGEWPSYGDRVFYIEAPVWAEAQFLEQRDAEDAA